MRLIGVTEAFKADSFDQKINLGTNRATTPTAHHFRSAER